MFRVPDTTVAIRHFSSMRTKLIAPFRASFVGVITNVGEVGLTQNGQHKRSFDLVDDQGAWMKCLALGKNAGAKCIKDGTSVVMYGCSARPGNDNVEATLLVTKESVIVPYGPIQHIPKRVFIDISSA